MLGSVLEGLSTAAAGGDKGIVSRDEYATVVSSTTSLKLAKMYFYYNGLNLLSRHTNCDITTIDQMHCG